MSTTIYLPYVDPRYEQEDVHFTEPATGNGLRIERFARQRCFVYRPDVNSISGYPRLIIGVPDDFPHLAKHAQNWSFSTVKQLAEAERLLIKRGVDVKAGRALFEDL